MTTTAPAPSKVTYTSANVDWELFHHQFDAALVRVTAQLGGDYPLYIGGEAVPAAAAPIVDTSPSDTSVVLGRFAGGAAPEVDRAVAAARRAQRAWEHRGWRDRVATLRTAAGLIRQRKFELAALMSLEVGKSRLESMGDAEESADLIDYYCQELEQAAGFVRPMAQVTPVERNTDVLRPYGVFACIAPFNFPLALSTGMSAAALIAGNTVVYKPAEDAPWTGLKLYEVYRDAGLPAGVFNYLSGTGEQAGEALWRHPGVDGVVFTGSNAVGMRIYHGLSGGRVKPCLLEMGGKNATLVLDTADLDAAAEGVARSAFGLQNQKCSATSRVYVHHAVRAPFVERLIAQTRALKIGDPTVRDVVFGPVISAAAVARFELAVAQARREGTILLGGGRLRGTPFDRGHFVAPTISELPLASSLFADELFVPLLAIGVVSGLDQAIAETNRVEYGLTAGIFSRRAEEIERFFDEVEAGVCYANKRTGATTGAWPGAQPFTGWKGSGSTGKGGCGPYYVAQFMREQSRTVIEDAG
ncbi:MAG TPA: aldehyde dehydrogenase family protein [Gemmatimonadales bacterium]|jgi:1-pyrroline-5-carboxylate dehydrogenase|nr:aldehyde dehydrogenase family protein [Gemmatimonadales bacterium]